MGSFFLANFLQNKYDFSVNIFKRAVDFSVAQLLVLRRILI